MARLRISNVLVLTALSLAAVPGLLSLGGCKSDADYAQAKTPPPSDPAALQAAINKLDATYESNYGSKYTSEVTPHEVAIGAALYRGDGAAAVTEINNNRKLFQDAIAASRSCLITLGSNTVIVNPTDHDAYANFYNAEGDRLNSKSAEYKAFLNLKPTASKADIAAVMDLISDARIKEFMAQKLKAA